MMEIGAPCTGLKVASFMISRGGEHRPWGDGHAAEVYLCQAVSHGDRAGQHGCSGEPSQARRLQCTLWTWMSSEFHILKAMQKQRLKDHKLRNTQLHINLFSQETAEANREAGQHKLVPPKLL